MLQRRCHYRHSFPYAAARCILGEGKRPKPERLHCTYLKISCTQSRKEKREEKKKDNRQKKNQVDEDPEAIEVPLYVLGRFNAQKHTWNTCMHYVSVHAGCKETDNKIFTAQVIVLKAFHIKKW